MSVVSENVGYATEDTTEDMLCGGYLGRVVFIDDGVRMGCRGGGELRAGGRASERVNEGLMK